MSGITRESERMSLLVDDLLLLARLDEGRPLEQKPVDLAAVVGEAVDAARVVEPDRPIELAVEPATVTGDEARLHQVLDNLLANARTHTPAGTPVSVELRQVDGRAELERRRSRAGTDRGAGCARLRALLPHRHLARPRERRRRPRPLDRRRRRRGARRDGRGTADARRRRDLRDRAAAGRGSFRQLTRSSGRSGRKAKRAMMPGSSPGGSSGTRVATHAYPSSG